MTLSKFSYSITSFITGIIFVAILAVSTVAHSTPAHAVTSADWNASNIIDDGVFYDNSSMSVADIQNFLNSKVSSCDTNGTQSAADDGYPNMTHAQYAALQGWPGPPYVCLKDYMQVPQSSSIVDNYSGSTPAGAISAAQIIKNAADTYGVNPKVIIVTLQKESLNLIYDTWPMQSQYKNAMGYGCPDTAPCDPSYAGFYNQVNNAAWQWNYYRQHAYDKDQYGNYIYRQQPYNTINLGYNPNASCGSSPVKMGNYATTGLYNYTPYQPNQAALNNLYGTGDSCSAYGNRNFWRIFNDWFGSTHAADYQWEVVSQQYFTDATKTTTASSDIPPGGSIHLVLKAKNTGNATWSNTTNPVNLATLPSGVDSIFCAQSWVSCNRPAHLQEASVAPGGVGTFEFDVTNPTNASGVYRLYVSLVAEGKAWFNNPAVNFYLTPQKAQYTWSLEGQQAFTDSTMTTPKDMWSIRGGESAYLVVKARNTGNITWTQNGTTTVHLATSHNNDRSSVISTQGWYGFNRPAQMTESSVAPGQVGTFAFPVTMPSQSGSYIEYFNLVAEGKSWFNDTGLNYYIKVQPDVYSWSIAGQQAFTDSTMSKPMNLWAIKPGQSAYLVIKAKNTGNVTWDSTGTNPIHLGTSRGNDRASVISTSSWYGFNRPATMSESSVAPGQTGTFAFPVTMPAQSGDYVEYFNLVAEGKTWLNDTGLNYYIKSYQ